MRRTIATGHQLNGLSIYGKRVNDSRCSLQSNIKIQDKYYEMCDWNIGSIERILSVDEFTPRMFIVNDHISFKLILSISIIWSFVKQQEKKTQKIYMHSLQLKKKKRWMRISQCELVKFFKYNFCT